MFLLTMSVISVNLARTWTRADCGKLHVVGSLLVVGALVVGLEVGADEGCLEGVDRRWRGR
jgi:hypothetical protein